VEKNGGKRKEKKEQVYRKGGPLAMAHSPIDCGLALFPIFLVFLNYFLLFFWYYKEVWRWT
jgi:hypothetical protein